ncbi:MAG TPA: hypothetical protein PK367_02630 [Candidatus Paceibacterota bacterium]|nr:hypothetical protein [Candidatus Paceibacterota bacterium]
MVTRAIKRFLKDPYFITPLIIGVVLWFIVFGVAYVQLFPLQTNLIIHLNFFREVDAIGSVADVIWLLIGLLIIFVIDQILAIAVYFRERIMAYVFSYAGLFVMILGSLAVYYLITFN